MTTAQAEFERDADAHGLMKAVMKRAKKNGHNLSDLTVLSPQIDPYRQDTPTNRRNAEWFKEQIQPYLSATGKVYLRGTHYKFNGNVYLPEGMRYINDLSCWSFLLKAAKSARWLGYVSFEIIFDNRNDEALIYVPEDVKPDVYLYEGSSVQYDMPDKSAIMPEFACSLDGRQQPFRIVFFGEKSSLSEVLDPIAKEIGAELILCTGEASDTRIEEMVRRAVDDGRPLVVLYFSDFDPSGWQMTISVPRKIQALKHFLYPGLRAQVHQVALTARQVKEFNLPDTPLKAEEKRAAKWKEKFGQEQTEIDSILALHPEALREITLTAIKPFYDSTYQQRADDAWWEWKQEADSLLESHPSYIAHQNAILNAYDALERASESLVHAQREAQWALRNIDPPVPCVPEIRITDTAPEPIFTTEDDYETATRKLINRKKLIGNCGQDL